MDSSTPLAVGMIAGAVASIFMGASGYGLCCDFVFGVAGAIVGEMTSEVLDPHAPYRAGAGVAVASVGAAIGLLALRHLKRSADRASRAPWT